MPDHPWVLQDDAEGNTYFFNTETEEALWEPPAGIDPATIKKAAVWSLIKDPSGDYFYNNVTGESAWERPPDYDGEEPAASAPAAGDTKTDDAAAAAPAPAPAPAAAATTEEASGGAGAGAGAGDSKAADDVSAAQKWVAVKDEASGGTYYYNQETGECQWEVPDDFQGFSADKAPAELLQKILQSKLKLARMDSATRQKVKEAQAKMKELKSMKGCDWVENYDPSAKQYYYYNTKTKETTWEKPEDYVMTALDDMVMAVVTIQCMYRGKIARGEIKIRKQKKLKWLECKDETSGLPYYYNQETGDVTWEKPADFMGATADQAPQEVLQKILKAKLKLAAMDSATRQKVKEAQAKMKEAESKGLTAKWVECYDPNSDAFYYTNKETSEVTWDKPEEYVMAADDEMMMAVVKIQCMFRGKIARGDIKIKKKSDWEPVEDEGTGKTYYYNKKTSEVTWVRPDELGGPEEGATEEASGADLERVLKVKLQEARLGDSTRARLREHLAKQQAAREQGLVDVWVECYDPASDGFYYHNRQSNEVTWEKPAEYVMAADDDMMRAVVKIQCLFRAKMARRRAEAMVSHEGVYSNTAHADAVARMKRLNEEEQENLRLMEELKKQKDFAQLSKRQKQKALEEAKRKQAEEQTEAEREAARAAKVEAERMNRIAKRTQRDLEERQRRERRKAQLAEMERKMAEKRAAEERAKEEARKERLRQRELRAAERKRKAEEARIQREKDHAAWRQLYADARSAATKKEREMNAADMRETRAREQEMINRRAFAEQRAQSQDAATRSVWDAAMHGVGPDRIRALLNLAVAEAADAQAIIEGGGEDPDIVLERVRPLEEIAAGVGTAPVSKAYWHVNCANELGESPLHVAAWRGHLAVVRALLQDGAEVNLVDSCASGITPLIESVRGGHREVAKALLKAGADVSAQDSGGDTALHWACRRGDRGMAAMLLEYDPDKASAKVRNNKHQTAAALAKGQGVARLMADFVEEPRRAIEPTPGARKSSASPKLRKSRKASTAAGSSRRSARHSQRSRARATRK